ncbi:hypothetical protein K8353_41115, partial [Burkholderia contaminans]|nr:hypothetical protein [Burkholderia contaminans]
VIATSDQELTSRKVSFLLQTPQQDGGQWDMVVSLFEKYGVVPKSVYPESVSSSSSRELNAILNKLLRQDAQILRDLLVSGADQVTVQAKKEDLLQEIFNFLAMSLGLPPRKFDFAYRDKDNNYKSEKGIIPVLVRPSYVLGGRAMEIVENEEDLRSYMRTAVKASPDHPVLVDSYIVGQECEVDAISDGKNV